MHDDLARRARGLRRDGERAVIGIAGPPAAGKSTLAKELTDTLDPAGEWAVQVPMDGFHLADAALHRLGLLDYKGIPETFDAFGYLAALRRIRTELTNPVYLPDFDRVVEQPVAGSIAVGPAVRLVVTEGNYLLLDEPPWPRVRRELTEVWYCDLSDDIRTSRLLARHVAFGKTADGARRWVERVDEPNGRQVAAVKHKADLVVDMAPG